MFRQACSGCRDAGIKGRSTVSTTIYNGPVTNPLQVPANKRSNGKTKAYCQDQATGASVYAFDNIGQTRVSYSYDYAGTWMS